MASRMRFVCCAIALACAAMAATATASTTHLVGGDAGWKIPNEVKFYATWAADKTFNVGDKLEFKWMGVHDVLEVTKEEYGTCAKAGTPQSTSPVTISLDTAGSKYFICSVGSHCMLGQKLSVTVGSNSSTTPAAPAPSSTPGSTTPAAPVPSSTPVSTTPAAPAPSSAPASLLANALFAAMFTIGTMFFTCL